MAGDNDGASSSRLILDDLVGGMEAFLLVGGTELRSEVVRSNGSKVSGRASGQNVLATKKGQHLLVTTLRRAALTWAARAAFWAAPPAT